MTEPVPSSFTPERAARYVAETMPELLARAAANLGEPGPDGSLHPDPNARAARVALLSAAEVLSQLGALAGDDVVVPQRAALARLEGIFVARHPELPLEMPKHPAGSSLEELVAGAWEAAAEPHPAAPPAAGAPSTGLPARGSAMELPD
jgi:hypothetical protein